MYIFVCEADLYILIVCEADLYILMLYVRTYVRAFTLFKI